MAQRVADNLRGAFPDADNDPGTPNNHTAPARMYRGEGQPTVNADPDTDDGYLDQDADNPLAVEYNRRMTDPDRVYNSPDAPPPRQGPQGRNGVPGHYGPQDHPITQNSHRQPFDAERFNRQWYGFNQVVREPGISDEEFQRRLASQIPQETIAPADQDGLAEEINEMRRDLAQDDVIEFLTTPASEGGPTPNQYAFLVDSLRASLRLLPPTDRYIRRGYPRRAGYQQRVELLSPDGDPSILPDPGALAADTR